MVQEWMRSPGGMLGEVLKKACGVVVAMVAVFFGTVGTLLVCTSATTALTTQTLVRTGVTATVSLVVCASAAAIFLHLANDGGR